MKRFQIVLNERDLLQNLGTGTTCVCNKVDQSLYSFVIKELPKNMNNIDENLKNVLKVFTFIISSAVRAVIFALLDPDWIRIQEGKKDPQTKKEKKFN
jgi:hypothetical protein